MSEIARLFILALENLSEERRVEEVNYLFRDSKVATLLNTKTLLSLINGKMENRATSPILVTSSEGKRHLRYDHPGRLTGPIRGRQVSVLQLPRRRFRTDVNGIGYLRLSMDFVEGELGIEVKRKSSGGNSETLSRAIYRHLVDRYNDGDNTVSFEPLN